MKRFTLIIALGALCTACTSRIPAGFQSTGPGTADKRDIFDDRPYNQLRDVVANDILNDRTPPEAILATVYFDFDKYTVSATERAKLDAIATRTQRTEIIIAGYTDHFGTSEYNLGLSDRRAQSVREYLVKLGTNQATAEIMALGSQHADKGAVGRQSAAKDRKAVIVDVNYTAGANRNALSSPPPAARVSPAAPATAGQGAPPPPVSAL